MRDLKGELEALAASAVKIEATARSVQHYLENDDARFATLALRMGEQTLNELVERYRSLLRRVEEPSNPV